MSIKSKRMLKYDIFKISLVLWLIFNYLPENCQSFVAYADTSSVNCRRELTLDEIKQITTGCNSIQFMDVSYQFQRFPTEHLATGGQPVELNLSRGNASFRSKDSTGRVRAVRRF